MKLVPDVLVRAAYVAAYCGMRLWWLVRRPTTEGSLVAIWHGDQLLVLRNSYRRLLSLPGGFARRGESARDAALRELREEVGVEPDPGALRVVYENVLPYEGRADSVTIFRLDVAERPEVAIDNREVVWAGYATSRELLGQPLLPHLQLYLERGETRGNGRASE